MTIGVGRLIFASLGIAASLQAPSVLASCRGTEAVAQTSDTHSAMPSAVATPLSPARVAVAPWTSAAIGEPPHLLSVQLGLPGGVSEPEQVIARIDLLIMDAAGALQKRVPLGPASFFGAREGEPPAGFVFDLASEPNLTDEDRQAVLEGRAAVEVAMPLVAGVSAASTVPVIGAQLIATPPA